MTSLDIAPQATALIARAISDDPRFAIGACLLLLLTLPFGAAMIFDLRVVDGANPWTKPMKFALSLALFLATLAWAAHYLPETVRDAQGFAAYQWLVLVCIAAEMVWIGGAALYATGSHFNTSTPLMSTLYGWMGIAAITLTSATAVYGALIWSLSDAPEAPMIGLSFIATFVATVIVAGYMAQNMSHHVGVPQAGAGVPYLGWSTEVGDLRPAHFFATHIMQIVPIGWFLIAYLLGDVPGEGTGLALTLLLLAVTAGTFAQALSGAPLFRLSG